VRFRTASSYCESEKRCHSGRHAADRATMCHFQKTNECERLTLFAVPSGEPCEAVTLAVNAVSTTVATFRTRAVRLIYNMHQYQQPIRCFTANSASAGNKSIVKLQLTRNSDSCFRAAMFRWHSAVHIEYCCMSSNFQRWSLAP
jgi:hypothetical protein